MAANNINILFWLHKSKVNKKGTAPLYLRISYNGIRKNISTGFFLSPKSWDQTRCIAKGDKNDVSKINAYMIQVRAKLMDLFNEMIKKGDINLDLLIDMLLGKDISQITLMELVDYHNEDIKKRIGIDYTESTFEKYDILKKKLEAFIPYQFKKTDIRLIDLSVQFIGDFDFYLKNHDKNQQNTATKYLKNLKKIMSVAVIKGWLNKNPFEGYKAVYKDVDRIYLTFEEIRAIEQKEFKSERLSFVKDLFLVQCYTGLAYVDLTKLTIGSIVPGVDGNKWIITRRHKTNVRSAIPLIKESEKIIARYINQRSNPESLLFDAYSIQKFNAYLHEIADICAINKNLTSHVGRRTFATTIALANGISLETISKMLGHSSTKITSLYAVVSDLKIAEDVKRLRHNLSKRSNLNKK